MPPVDAEAPPVDTAEGLPEPTIENYAIEDDQALLEEEANRLKQEYVTLKEAGREEEAKQMEDHMNEINQRLRKQKRRNGDFGKVNIIRQRIEDLKKIALDTQIELHDKLEAGEITEDEFYNQLKEHTETTKKLIKELELAEEAESAATSRVGMDATLESTETPAKTDVPTTEPTERAPEGAIQEPEEGEIRLDQEGIAHRRRGSQWIVADERAKANVGQIATSETAAFLNQAPAETGPARRGPPADVGFDKRFRDIIGDLSAKIPGYEEISDKLANKIGELQDYINSLSTGEASTFVKDISENFTNIDRLDADLEYPEGKSYIDYTDTSGNQQRVQIDEKINIEKNGKKESKFSPLSIVAGLRKQSKEFNDAFNLLTGYLAKNSKSFKPGLKIIIDINDMGAPSIEGKMSAAGTYNEINHTLTIPVQMFFSLQDALAPIPESYTQERRLKAEARNKKTIDTVFEIGLHELIHSKDITLLDRAISGILDLTGKTKEQQDQLRGEYNKIVNNVNHNLAKAYKNQIASFLKSKYDQKRKSKNNNKHEDGIMFMFEVLNVRPSAYSDIINFEGTVDQNIDNIIKYALDRGKVRVGNRELNIELSYYIIREMVAYHSESVNDLKSGKNKWINDFMRRVKQIIIKLNLASQESLEKWQLEKYIATIWYESIGLAPEGATEKTEFFKAGKLKESAAEARGAQPTESAKIELGARIPSIEEEAKLPELEEQLTTAEDRQKLLRRRIPPAGFEGEYAPEDFATDIKTTKDTVDTLREEIAEIKKLLRERDTGRAEEVDLSKRKFIKQVGGVAAGAAVDPTILAEGATKAAPIAGAVVKYPVIDTIYRFAVAAGKKAADGEIHEGEIIYEVTFDSSEPNEIEVSVDYGDGPEVQDVFEISPPDDMKDVDKIVSDMITEGVTPMGSETEWDTKAVYSVQPPDRDPWGESGDDGGPVTRDEKEGYTSADLDYLENVGGEVSGVGPVDSIKTDQKRIDTIIDKEQERIEKKELARVKQPTEPTVDVAATLLDTAIKEKVKETTEEPKTREEQRKKKLAAEKETKGLPWPEEPPEFGARVADYDVLSDDLKDIVERASRSSREKEVWDEIIDKKYDIKVRDLGVLPEARYGYPIIQNTDNLRPWNPHPGGKKEDRTDWEQAKVDRIRELRNDIQNYLRRDKLKAKDDKIEKKEQFNIAVEEQKARKEEGKDPSEKNSWFKKLFRSQYWNPIQMIDIVNAILDNNGLYSEKDIANYLTEKWESDAETKQFWTLDVLKELPDSAWPDLDTINKQWIIKDGKLVFPITRNWIKDNQIRGLKLRIRNLPEGKTRLEAKKVIQMKDVMKDERTKTKSKSAYPMRLRIAKKINTPAFYMWLIKEVMTDSKFIPEKFKNIISKDSLAETKSIFNDKRLKEETRLKRLATLHKFSKKEQDLAWEEMLKLVKILEKRTGVRFARDHIVPIKINKDSPGGLHAFPFWMPLPHTVNGIIGSAKSEGKDLIWKNGIPQDTFGVAKEYFTVLYREIEKYKVNSPGAFLRASIAATNAANELSSQDITVEIKPGAKPKTRKASPFHADLTIWRQDVEVEILGPYASQLMDAKEDTIGAQGVKNRRLLYDDRAQTSKDIQGILDYVSSTLDDNFGEPSGTYSALVPEIETEVEEYKTSMGAHQRWWQIVASFMWSKPVEAIRRYRYASPTMAKLADMIQRDPSATKRVIKGGLDYIQRKGMAMGQFRVALQATLDELTSRVGVIPKHVNDAVIMYLVQGKSISNPKVAKHAERLKQILESIYVWSAEHGSKVTSDFSLRPLDGGLLPRVWNVEELATPEGRAKFMELLKKIGIEDNPDAETEFEKYAATNAYNIAVNSGGFISGDFTTTAYNQKSKKARQFQVELFEKIEKEVSRAELGTLLVNDLQALLPRFVDKAVEKTLYAELFGHYDEKLWEMKEQIEKEIAEYNRKNPDRPVNLSRAMQDINDMMAILRHRYKMDSSFFGARRFIQWFMNFTTVTMMPMVALASMPEFFTPLALGSKNPIGFLNDFRMAGVYAGMRAMNGMSKLFFGKQLDAMKFPKGKTARRAMFLKALGIIDIRTMGEAAAMRYIGPSFIRTGIGTANVGSRKYIKALYKLYGLGEPAKGRFRARSARSITNMDTFFELTFLTTMTQMQQIMAANNFRRYVLSHLKSLSKGKRASTLDSTLDQQRQELRDFGFTDAEIAEAIRWYEAGHREFYDIPAEFKFDAAGATLRFVDQVITRPNEATAAKAFRHPAMAPLLLFKSFMTTYANTYMVAIRDRVRFAQGTGGQKHYQRAKQVAGLGATFAAMYGMVLFAQSIRQMLQFGPDDDDDNYMSEVPEWKKFIANVNRTGLLTAPGSQLADIWLPYKYGWWQSPAKRTADTLFGPGVRQGASILDLIGDLANKGEVDIEKFLAQLIPVTKFEAFRNITGAPSYYERDDDKGKYKL